MLYAPSEILRKKSIKERIHTGVKIRRQERQWCKYSAEISVSVIIRRPTLPHLSRMEWQITDGEGTYHYYEHFNDAFPRS